MNKYEIMFIVKTTNEATDIKKTAEGYKSLMTSLKGKVEEFKELGEKKLAYPINKEVNGFYYVLEVEANADAIHEFDRKIQLDENIIRHLIIRKEEE